MFRSRLLAAQLGLCLLAFFFLSFSRTTSAAPLDARGGPVGGSDPFKDPSSGESSSGESDPFSDCKAEDLDIDPFEDGPTADRTAGLGVEFETGGFYFTSVGNCGKENTFASKNKAISGHQATDWDLTVDTTAEMSNRLDAEYILNGKIIKLGTNQAVQAAKDVASDIERWDPHATSKNNKVVLVDPVNNQCKTWEIKDPQRTGGWKSLMWQAQATAPLPMAALNVVFKYAKTSNSWTNPLLPAAQRMAKDMVWVNKNFFQSSPQGIKAKDVTAEEMAFFSLVLSYVKTDPEITAKTSFKNRSPIMPRTNFVSLFEGVESSLKGKDLYELVQLLACYKNVKPDGHDTTEEEMEKVEIDGLWCKGPLDKPTPLPNINSKWTLTVDGDTPFKNNKDLKDITSFTVKDWMEGIQNKGSKLEIARKALGSIAKDKKEPTGALDLMEFYDRWFDHQIGAYGEVRERIYGNPHLSVPLFEFRNLGSVGSQGMETMVRKIENQIIQYHHSFSTSGTPTRS
ncbi:uncharacterized protein N7498_006080 [Penicillium cinerascens]|uniref:Uncharacterized protein n=1 Tax=Penicillium cinerascens TaxID=70096 RepID=A0A9W9MHK6_9EURO|nr:uncharacterized protein N7498_006080 [Penicillium cinerascens]KAJ5201417.1 hypothetical protein N7498_006080 [Penicillium cinerascens]